MKRKTIIALAIASTMSLSMFAIPAAATVAQGDQTVVEENADDKKADQDKTGSAKKCNRHGKREKIEKPENAIGRDNAKAAALDDAGITADHVEKIRVRLSALDDGTVVYKVGFTVDGQYYSYKINAITGEIADKTVQSEQEHKAAESHDGRKKKEHSKINNSTANTDQT